MTNANIKNTDPVSLQGTVVCVGADGQDRLGKRIASSSYGVLDKLPKIIMAFPSLRNYFVFSFEYSKSSFFLGGGGGQRYLVHYLL